MSTVWIWLWTVDACEGGDIDAIVAKAKQYRVGVLVKTHDGATSNPNGQRGFLLVEALRAAKVPVRAWGYCYPGVHPRVQAYFAAQAGVDYIADVEVEWDGHAEEAEKFVYELRQAMPGRLVGYAPLPIISYHDTGQYAAFNRLDVACPQAYAGTGGRSAIGALQWTEDEWARAFPGCNIEPAVYAADQSPEDLRAAIAGVRDRATTFGYDGDVSVWSWQHMTPEHWQIIDEFTKEVPVSNDPVYLGQSVTVVTLKRGEVGWLNGVWKWPDGRERTVTKKVYGETVGMKPYVMYPPADPDTDPTEDLDAQPGVFVVAVSDLA